jgi:outer membrane immunogenic protein
LDWFLPRRRVGYDHLRNDFQFEDEGTQFSFFAGYLHDLGNFVVGAELEYLIANNWDVAVGDEDDILSLTGVVGFDLGRIMPYISAGVGVYDSSSFIDSDTLMLLGIGSYFQLTDHVRIGGNYEIGFNDEFDAGFGPFELDTETFSIRVVYNF